MRQKIIILTILCCMVLAGHGLFSYAAFSDRMPSSASEPQEPTTVVTGKASWYSQRDAGIRRRTADNEIFNDSDLTCAMWGVPFNQMIRVTNLANGKSVVVRVNDRGPHRRFVRQGRVIDLTKTAFQQIASINTGLINVRLEFIR